MAEQFTYKGFSGSATVSFDDDCLHGRILFIGDVITYEGEKIADLKLAFELAVDEYLDYCAKNDKAPSKPYSGTFNVRLGANLHRQIAELAYISGGSLNDYVSKALQFVVDNNFSTKNEQPYKHLTTVKNEAIANKQFATASLAHQKATYQTDIKIKSLK